MMFWPKISRKRFGRALLFILAVCTSFGEHAHGMLQRIESGDRWAFIIQAEQSGHDQMKQLIQTLRDYYGYNNERILFISRDEATSENIHKSMSKLYHAIGPNDSLFVFLSLPVGIEMGMGYFVPSDGKAEKPWTLLTYERLVDWINALQFETALILYPSPSREQRKVEDYMLTELSYSKRRGSIDLITYGQVQSISKSDSEFIVTKGMGQRIAAEVVSALRNAVTNGLSKLSGDKLVDSIVGSDGVFAKNMRIPEYVDLRFYFTASPSKFSGYRTRYLEAEDKEQLLAALNLLFSAASTESGGLARSAIAFLKEIALDKCALIPNLDPKLAETQRFTAIQLLGKLDSTEAKDAIGEIALNALDAGSVRLAALTAISRFDQPREEDRLVIRKAIGDRVASVREAAVRAAVVIHDKGSVELISDLLSNLKESQGVRIASIQSLSVLGGNDYMSVITNVLKDESPSIRREAASALARMGSSSNSTKELVKLLEEDDVEFVRQEAALALARTWTQKMRQLVLESLEKAILIGPDSVRESAVYSLGQVGGEEAQQILRNTLSNEGNAENVRIAAAEALRQPRNKSAISVLEKASYSESVELRQAATVTLGIIGTEEAAKILLKKLKDEDPGIQDAARSALNNMDTLPSEILLQDLASESSSIRIDAIRKLGKSDKPDDLDLLIAALADKDNRVREAAIESLAGSDSRKSIDKILSALKSNDSRVRRGAIAALGRKGNPKLAPYIMEATNDNNSAVRAEAIRALASLNHPEIVKVVQKGIVDDDPEVRLAALEAYPSVFKKSALTGLSIQEIARKDPSQKVRLAAGKILRGLTEDWISSEQEEVSYNVDFVNDKHNILLSKSTQRFSKSFSARPGKRIVSYKWLASSINNANIVKIEIAPDGTEITLVADITTGPYIDKWRGWVKGSILTTQTPIKMK